MSAGTLKLTNGSTAVTGTGTTFTTDMTAADVVVVTVGGTVYSLAIDSVTSDTALVLSLPFTGPTTTGVAWQAVPRKTMLRVTAELNKQVTESLRVANENAINWQAVLSSHDTVNVLLPDGTTLTGFSWRKINDLLTVLDPDDLSATAAQINTDAQQVATDKPIIIQAKTDAETAKTASETAQGKAETAQQKSEAAQGKSETAQAAAELAATNAAGTLSYILGNFQPLDPTLKALAALVGVANKLPYFNGDDTAALTDLTQVGRDIIGKSTIADILTYLGLGGGSILPVGVPVPWPLETPPAGWMKCNGAPFSAEEYPELAKAYPTNKLPDLRGEFIRGWDDGRRVDPSRNLGSSQTDQLQNHGHSNIRISYTGAGGGSSGLPDGGKPRTGDSDLVGPVSSTNFAGGQPRVGAETRPRNVAFNYIVRAV